MFPPHADPRLAAGAPLTNDVLKCTLKPPNRSDYKLPLTNAQFARLQATFPDGVCDYDRPGIGQQRAGEAWLSY
jgi:hypothetical protein